MPAFRSTRPRFRATLLGNTPLSAGLAALELDAVEIDDVGGWVSNTYIADRPGLYLVHCNLGFTAIAGASRPEVYVRRQGVDVAATKGNSVAGVTCLSITDVVPMEASQDLQFMVRRSATHASTLVAAETWAFITRIGPKAWT